MGRAPSDSPAVASRLAGSLLPAAAAAHPLGNFTINHYAGITDRPERDPTSTS